VGRNLESQVNERSGLNDGWDGTNELGGKNEVEGSNKAEETVDRAEGETMEKQGGERRKAGKLGEQEEDEFVDAEGDVDDVDF